MGKRVALVQPTGHGNVSLAKGVRHLSFTQARGVVFEGQLLFRVVQAETAQAIGVGELSQMAQLVVAQRGLQFVSNFHECHGGIISASRKWR